MSCGKTANDIVVPLCITGLWWPL